jgi:hypothetical protein
MVFPILLLAGGGTMVMAQEFSIGGVKGGAQINDVRIKFDENTGPQLGEKVKLGLDFLTLGSLGQVSPHK